MSLVQDQHTDTRSEIARPRRRSLPGGRRLRDGHYLYWWVEVLAIVAFYVVYSTIRNLHHGNAAEAFQHAKEVMRIQRDLGINHEQAIQDWALGFRPLIVAANYFYGSLHFVVTGGVMVYLFRKWSNAYPLWRNALAVGTGLALIGFALFPLMPPRLLPAHYGFVDTLAKDPAFWSFNSGAVSKISTQYAAMPSVHCAWALWCACALIPRVKHWWAKVLAGFYPVATVTAIVITANHYLIDAPAGFVALGIGYVAARAFTRAGRGRALDQPAELGDEAEPCTSERPRAGYPGEQRVTRHPDERDGAAESTLRLGDEAEPSQRLGVATANEPTDQESDQRAQKDNDDQRRSHRVRNEVDANLIGVEQGEHQE
jgi:PAP2 superfamily